MYPNNPLIIVKIKIPSIIKDEKLEIRALNGSKTKSKLKDFSKVNLANFIDLAILFNFCKILMALIAKV